MNCYVTRALIIAEPWISLILSGQKTWEMRSRATNISGWIGLVRKGSGQVVGIAKLSGSGERLDKNGMLATLGYHHIPERMIESGEVKNWNIPWYLSEARAFSEPVPYVHKSGAVTFVSLDDDVAQIVSKHVGKSPVTASPNAAFSEPKKRTKVTAELTGQATQSRHITAEEDTANGEVGGRLLGISQITGGNLKNNHFYLRSFLDAFPEELVGGRDLRPPRMAVITAAGAEATETDICPRHRFFRDRSWTRRFFEGNNVQAGDHIAVYEVGANNYLVKVYSKI